MTQLITTVSPSAGTAAQFGTSRVPYRTISVRARPSNATACYIGGSDVTSTNGIELNPGDDFSFTTPNIEGERFTLQEWYADTANGTNSVDVFVFNG